MAAGLAFAPVLGFHGLIEAGPTVLMTGGSATLPDLDCPSSSASRRFGRVSRWLSQELAGMSGRLYQRTKRPRDETWSGKHRHLSHTLAFALVVGGALAGLCLLVPPAALAVYALLAVLTADRLGDYVLWIAGVGLVPLAHTLLTTPHTASWQIGVAVALGMLTHDLGDSLTLTGCPLLALIWPFPIAGETWYEIRPLGPLSFRTNGPVEHLVLYPLLLGATAALAATMALPPTVAPAFPLVAGPIALAVGGYRTIRYLTGRFHVRTG